MLAFRKKMTPEPLRIPRLQPAAPRVRDWFGAPVFRVVAPGAAGGLDLQEGDLLVLDHGGVSESDLVLLTPQRHGRPMLGRLTKDGLLSEPGRTPVDIGERWHIAGRVILRVRRHPGRAAKVLPFVDREELDQPELPFSDLSQLADGPHVHIEFDRPPPAAVVALLRRRLPGFALLGEQEARIDGCELFEDSPLEVLGSLAAELRSEFDIQLRAVVADSRDSSMAVLGLLPMDTVAVLRPGARYASPRRPRRGPDERKPQPPKQLGLFGA
jgi:hypothetical protein